MIDTTVIASPAMSMTQPRIGSLLPTIPQMPTPTNAS